MTPERRQAIETAIRRGFTDSQIARDLQAGRATIRVIRREMRQSGGADVLKAAERADAAWTMATAVGTPTLGNHPDGRLLPQEPDELRKAVTELNERLQHLEARAVPVARVVQEVEERARGGSQGVTEEKMWKALGETQAGLAEVKAALQQIQPQAKELARLAGRVKELCGLYPELCTLVQASRRPHHLVAGPSDVQGGRAAVIPVRAVKVAVKAEPQPTEQVAREPERIGFFRTTPGR